LGKGLGRGSEVKAFTRCVVVGGHEAAETVCRKGRKVSFARHEATHPADGVLDTSLLPGRVGITEEGIDRQTVQRAVSGKLGAVVEGDGLAKLFRQAAEQGEEMARDAVSGLAGQADRQQKTRLALVHGQDRLAVFGEHHQVCFPMTAGRAAGYLDRPFCQGNTAFDEARRSPTLPAPAATLALAAGQVAPPAIVLGTGQLGVDETVDALVGDYLAPVVPCQPASDLLRRPAACKPLNDGGSQALIALQPRALPAPGAGLLVGVASFVSHLSAAIALQFPRDR
jgi:hypothetical protein